ncbi:MULTISPECIES: PTS sugar transporter subunit IIA [unclassified Enterococcus]|uniref:PTS sugar transporter subunit IIA n=1 Tax=unclassified Enterococcus TaxID=2608891 RepID=UPI001554220B|nr:MULTISPECIES: PTS sugar transporter subunit IIA [unclassified Enterococcus]MBS7576081.1 PTS sugar transporter subunit IIA [Enterococcus sp. MMGLQ5-2]MBS7583314.1 PTS sugar transporter subunit IIA [Enterococcus sp. MMGLQ5-1]NPD11174.1 PTS sugar transporter subunit IIA [Enterococcus sp. MMGLQ5-1]NPD35917.1 PTS sugar transporter subunit IIA [Enterococcus sp. MMGLQ5-2]
MITKDLVFHKIKFNNQDELFDYFSDDLEKKGIVKSGFATALKAREAEFPTGLPVPNGVAIPHTDGSLVLKDRIIFATLENAIQFNEMGGDAADKIDVQVVIMLAIAGGQKHLDTLQKLILAIQNQTFISDMLASTNQEAMLAIVEKELMSL